MIPYHPRRSVFMHHTCQLCKRTYVESGQQLEPCVEKEHEPLKRQLVPVNG